MKIITFLIISLLWINAFACSMFYYKDSKSGKVFFVNNEDYWYDVKPYIQIMPSSKNEFGRIWYGWDSFGQGGINEKGFVLDGASTPLEKTPLGYSDPKRGNVTDDILASCATVDEAIEYLEVKKIALKNAHIFFGDKSGKAAIVEWVDGKKQIVDIQNNRLIATNFNVSKIGSSGITCGRFNAIQKGLQDLDAKIEAKNGSDTIDLKAVGNVIASAIQMPQKDSTGKVGGTLYSAFLDLSAMKLVFVYKLDNSTIQEFDIIAELKEGKKRKIKVWEQF